MNTLTNPLFWQLYGGYEAAIIISVMFGLALICSLITIGQAPLFQSVVTVSPAPAIFDVGPHYHYLGNDAPVFDIGASYHHLNDPVLTDLIPKEILDVIEDVFMDLMEKAEAPKTPKRRQYRISHSNTGWKVLSTRESFEALLSDTKINLLSTHA